MGKGILRCWVGALLATGGLCSCQSEDRVVTVTCAAPPRDTLTVVLGVDRGRGRRAVLSATEFAPGTILERDAKVNEALRQMGVSIYQLRTSEGDFAPEKVESWVESVVGAEFEVQPDSDVQAALRLLKLDLRQQVTRNTALVSVGARRRELQDPLGLLNADREAVRLIETEGTDKRFSLVYAASYGQGISLAYSEDSLAANTVPIPGFYLHLQYACSSLDQLNARAESSRSVVPFMFFLMAVKFDRSRASVVSDENQSSQ